MYVDGISSHPSRVRGLKSAAEVEILKVSSVAPFAGAWIEIWLESNSKKHTSVAPFAGAWIEITLSLMAMSFRLVAPFAGAWIEILAEYSSTVNQYASHFRGCVD